MDAGVALERLEHRQIGPVVGYGDDPAEVADGLVVVECQGERDPAGHGSLGSLAGAVRTGASARFQFNRIDVARQVCYFLNRFAKPVCCNLAGIIQAAGRPDQRSSEGDPGSMPEEGCVEHQVARRVTIADVAEAAGVSKTAVSFAFNNPGRLARRPRAGSSGSPMSSAIGPTRWRGCSPSARTGTIGIVTPQALASMFSNPFFGMFSAGVAAVAEDAGYGLHFISPLHGSLSRAIARAIVDGVVAIGLAADHPEIAEIRRAGLPMATVDSDPFDKRAVDRCRRRGRRPRRGASTCSSWAIATCW